MNANKFRVTLLMTTLIAVISACSLPGASPEATEPAPTEVLIATEAPATEEPSIQHTVIPPNGLPEKLSGQATDFDSSQILEKKTPIGGDRFTFGRFERPFNANTMDVYFSQLDIVDTNVFQDDIWIFASIKLNELKADSSGPEKYAVEIDDDLNGKGDWLILGLKPQSSDWSVNGVQIYQDTNQDVGAAIALLTDEGSVITGDGFETMIFDQGQGNDPDSAWVRISPNDPNIIEFAIKKSVLGDLSQYMINMWAGTALDPAKFDINDQFTHEEAGAADAGLSIFYPIKAVAELDNSCRMAVGFQPTGKELGLCQSYIPESVDAPLPPSAGGCQATQTEIDACNADASYSWNAGSCSCVYTGPR